MLKLSKSIHLDCDTNTLTYLKYQHILTEKEKKLLIALWENSRHGSIVTHDSLISLVWPDRADVTTTTNLTQLICKLRKTLHYCGIDDAIRTIYREGYRLLLPETERQDSIDNSEYKIKEETHSNILYIIYKHFMNLINKNRRIL